TAADAEGAKLENQWPSAAKAIKAAKSAEASGDLEKALALATEAKALADLEVAQGRDQAAALAAYKLK
ncbi:MAG: hypothetical protein KGI57_13530, partial [Hyphomicrobiales bacterium]|nr:hypothetical protein [Hyphomicrobiales bacterium]MDE2018713.1 hypothetical protein [Hyphomicrobiales bacterium]